MIKFFEKNSITIRNQYGFWSKRSCADTMASGTELIRIEIDEKSKGQACFVDLQKTFDTLDNTIFFNMF